MRIRSGGGQPARYLDKIRAKGFSPTNLRYMMRFYELFKDITITPQLGEQLSGNGENEIVPQVEEQFKYRRIGTRFE